MSCDWTRFHQKCIFVHSYAASAIRASATLKVYKRKLLQRRAKFPSAQLHIGQRSCCLGTVRWTLLIKTNLSKLRIDLNDYGICFRFQQIMEDLIYQIWAFGHQQFLVKKTKVKAGILNRKIELLLGQFSPTEVSSLKSIFSCHDQAFNFGLILLYDE